MLQYVLADAEEANYKNMSYAHGVIADSIKSLNNEIEALKPTVLYPITLYVFLEHFRKYIH